MICWIQSLYAGAIYLNVCKNAFNQDSGEEAKLVEVGIKAVLAGERETFHLRYPCHSPHQQGWFHRLGLMGDMASGIVHEVKQPLAAIINYTQASLNFLKTENYDRVKFAGIIQKVQMQALRTSEIIQKMRDFIKSHAMQSIKADVNALITAVSILCAAQLNDNHINLVSELENNLPMIDVDHIQIEQVIINLVRNSADALQSIPEATPRQITVHSQLTPNNELQISVKDNGFKLW
jgi:two-component system sensor kinase FixL